MSMKIHPGIIFSREIEELGEKPSPAPFFPPKIIHTLTRERIGASMVKRSSD
jgi:hypothetical protein